LCVLLSSFYAPSPLSVVRAVQFGILVELIVTTAAAIWRNPGELAAFWRRLRQGLLAVATAATVISVGFHPSSAAGGPGFSRYTWLAMHPIATGAFLGATILVTAASLVGERSIETIGGRFRSPRILFLLPFLAVFVVLLVQTRARGATGATLIGVALLVALGAGQRAGRFMALALVAGAGIAIVYLPSIATSDLVARGQTQQQLLGLSGRYEIFDKTSELFLHRPVQGYGYLAGRSIFLESIPWAGNGHNALVEIVVSMGLIGVTAYFVLFFCWFSSASKLVRRAAGPARLLSRFSLAFAAYVLVSAAVADGFGGAPGIDTGMFAVGVLLITVAPRIASWEPDRSTGTSLVRYPSKEPSVSSP
jgi:O-antigen ligase